jgi:2-polyprenyl-6-methoxyphenol hydroxylase-like FAD-dependent oxidoreductase
VKKKVLIVGAGIAGLSIANLLDTTIFDIEIVEKRPQLDEEGYVIGIWANGLRALQNMPNLYQNMVEKGIVSEYQLLTDAKGRTLRKTNLQSLNEKYGGVVTFVSRGDLHQNLLAALPKNIAIALNKSILNIFEKNNASEVVFADGEKKEYDIIIGADGINSKVRSLIFPDHIITTHNADYFYCLLDKPATIEKITGDIEMTGVGDYVGVYPYRKNGKIGLYICIADAQKNGNNLSFLKSKLSYFASPFKECLATLDENTPVFRDKLKEVTLEKWYAGRTVLLGDAAHAMLPTTGQGISAAMEDAVALAKLLNKHSDDWASVFQQYQRERKPSTDAIQQRSRLINHLVLLKNPFLCWCRDRLIALIGLLPKEKSLDKFFEKAMQQNK